ncbi:MAG: GNAT family N-acetyltransferase [Flavobacteriaceae bacterium]|nr:GNAT family N-acetyltransferase [Flavobacteriaceae bacterium]
MQTVRIRDAEPGDLPTLLIFEQALIEAERPFDPTIADDAISYYDLGAYIARDDVKVMVAEIEGQVVSSGYALAKTARHYLDHEQYGYLGFMYTLPEFRGRGINQQIVEALKHWCLACGLHEIRLTVYEDNLPAIRAYEKAGFKKHLVEMRIE